MTARLLPFAAWRPVSYRADAGSFTQTPLGWILHVVVGDGSPFGTFEGAVSPDRRFSTGWVAKDGHVEEFTELTMRSWAQASGNPLYWSFETEGFPNEPLTDAQILSLAKIHNVLGAADAVIDKVGDRGVGTHVMGGAEWGGHSCPGPIRAGQRADIIAKARELRGPNPGPVASSVPTVFRTPHPVVKVLQKIAQKVTRSALVVDGVMGPTTIHAWQLVMGTRADGLISKPSSLVMAVQRRLGVPVDGYLGVETWKAVQRRLGFTGLAVDGVPGPRTVKALQRRLNGGGF
jgi:hypothetical protein